MPQADFLYVYEDWPAPGRDPATSMLVTAYLLREGFDVVGMARDGHFQRLGSAEEALEFNAANAVGHEPSNFVGCRRSERFFGV
jgi:hypothetical protein